MPHYRMFVLNGVGRVERPGIDIDCADDAAALRTASRHDGAAPLIEIWTGRRLVGRVRPSLACDDDVKIRH